MKTALTILGMFAEGLLSFFSPCVLPLIPLYISYLTRDAQITDEDGNVTYDRSKTLTLTLGFVLGISTVFFLAGLGSRLLNAFFVRYTVFFQIAGGILLILFGLVSAGIINISFLSNSTGRRIDVTRKFTFSRAYMTGFLFSFVWSPCVGPLLAQAMMVAAQSDGLLGWIYILAYTLGFILIFLIAGIFTQSVLSFLKKSRPIAKYTAIIASIVLIVMGGYMLYQGAQSISALQNSNQSPTDVIDDYPAEVPDQELTDIEKFDFTLPDKNGKSYKLSQFKGKTVLLNFFGTWCHYCNEELPTFKKIQETRDDIQIILISHPGHNSEGDISYIEQYLSDRGYNFLVLHDTTLAVLQKYGVTGFPFTFVFAPDGSALGYVPGYMPEESWMEALSQ